MLYLILTEAAKDLEMGNQTSKQHAELKNQRNSDYSKSLSDRIKEGLEVKTFQNQKRIDFGRMDENERNYRQRTKRELKSHDPYSVMI